MQQGAAATAPARDGEIEWFLPPFFMLRVAGLPIDAVVPLRFPDTVAWAERVLDLERELGIRKEPIGAALEAAVGDTDDGKLRRRLLDLRRDVFNLRLPRNPDDAERLAVHLDPVARDLLTEWLALRRLCDTEMASGEQILAVEVTERRRHLHDLAGDPTLRHGLLLASPSLDRYLPTYLGKSGGSLSKRARRIERSLLEYVYRTACKTSPFSTLTAVALGRFGQTPALPMAVDDVDAQRCSYTRLNLAALARLTDAITSQPRLCADLPVEVTSGWRTDDKRIRYVRRQRRISDDDAAVPADLLEENLFYLSSGQMLEELLTAAPRGVQIRFDELVDRLHEGNPGGRRREDVEAYLRHMMRLGLLTVPVLHVDIHHPDPLRSFRDGIARLGPSWTGDLVERLDLIAGHVADYPRADLPDRRRLLDAIRSELGEAQHDLGREEATTPRTLVYEDVTLGRARVVADRAQWEERMLPALHGLSRILPAFDMTLPSRLVTKGFFRARYGDGGEYDDVIKFAHEFHQDCYEEFMRSSMNRRAFGPDNEYVPQQNWFRLPEIDALDNARRELARRMREARESLPPDAGELVLDDDFVDGVAAHLPDGIGELDPRSFFLQIADVAGEPLGVLNRVYNGLTLLFSRFAHCFPDTDGHQLVSGLRDTLSEVRPEGAVFAELTGGYDTTNLNLHPSVTPYELVCPGDISSRPASEQIPVDDLFIVDDQETNQLRLRSRRLDVTVIPVYLGFLLPFALPEVQRVLLTFSYTSMAAPDLWAGVDRPPDDDMIVSRPRIRYRNLVLQRRTWKAHPTQLPHRGAAGEEARWFRDWTRWSRENGLPRQVFLSNDTAPPPRATDSPVPGDGEAESRAPTLTKPQYVDFDSYFALTLLDNVVKSADRRLVMTEMLPAEDQLWLRSEHGRHVTELTVETNGVWRRTR